MRQTISLPQPPTTAAWAPLLEAAHVEARDQVLDFTFPTMPDSKQPEWARAVIAVGGGGGESVVLVPRDMPVGATAWVQVVRLALEIVLGDRKGSEGQGEGDIASKLVTPMTDPVRIAEPRGAEAVILPQDFEDEKKEEGKEGKHTLFDRFRRAL